MATTGVPALIDSSTTFGHDSRTDVITHTSAAASPISNPVHVPGGERLTFREVVRRIAIAANIRYIEIPMPSLPFALGGRYLANVGRLGGSLAACVRMSEDLTVPDDAALLGVHRRGFYPDTKAIGRAE